jgi:ubiquinone/menaquinone biosynthesis C-methylase UbiE
MESIKYLYELMELMPRCGPGSNQFTRKAFRIIKDLPDDPNILDIGCGPGVQTLEIARLSKGQIIAIDNHQAFLDTLIKNAKDQNINNITAKNMDMNKMDFPEDSFDLIWSEGALYFLGFASGLKRCHQLLKPKGYLAVTHLVYLADQRPKQVSEYLEAESSEMMTVQSNIEIIKNTGFDLIGNFTLPKSAWLIDYFAPMELQLVLLKQKHQDNKTALDVFEAFSHEIDMYRQYSEYYGYEFFIMRKG